ncbi:SDR family NAD(P)-dependent oxidoreductase [Pseudomonas sp. Marseille-P9899]|uniref:SDR family NAD(P)-dependent oxidoreductase n=1 Tax=Pseudomonas sp. Marseille-P9899 TaxID=2730401 RepID=UPI00158AD1DF|nr:SDR family NAD(P)-dependent oxidoreductase [Pseudomonas sp. Marseille-P9899]
MDSTPPVTRHTDLAGKVALVTGASSGLGRRFALVLAAAGASVIVAGRREQRLRELVTEIKQAGGQAFAQVMDVRDSQQLPALIEGLVHRHGSLDILVNNAGIGRPASALQTTAGDIDELLFTNVRAPFVLSSEVARHLIGSGRPGRIVNIASVGAFHYSPGMNAALYCACKSAVVRLTEALAMEWARHSINVNAIAPGLFETEMTQGQLQEHAERMLSRLPRRRAGQPEQLDSSLLYLVSPQSEFVTGICLRVDDAQYAR